MKILSQNAKLKLTVMFAVEPFLGSQAILSMEATIDRLLAENDYKPIQGTFEYVIFDGGQVAASKDGITISGPEEQ